MNIPSLKQCPFCGGTPKIDTHYGSKNLITIRCEGCGAELTRMTSFGAGEAIDRVSEAWNRRVNKNQ